MQFNNKMPVVDAESETNIEDISEYSYGDGVSVYFAFIDVLGFSQAFDEEKYKNEGGKPQKIAKRYKDVFEYYFELLHNTNFYKLENQEIKCYAGQTSDSLYFYTDDRFVLRDFIKFYLCFSLFAMTNNVFFRGGIARGELFINSNDYQFYGDSVINAYRLESMIAKKPAVYVDSECRNIIEDDPELKDIIQPDGNRHFINPFAGLKIDNTSFLTTKGLSILKDVDTTTIKNHIKDNIINYEFNVNIFEKYSFLNDILETIMREER